jgi:hypothetical protein
MTKTKLGLAALAALAAMSIGSAAAQAAVFKAAEYPAFISGEQASPGATVFGFESGQTANCETVGFANLITEATSGLELSPGYAECEAFGGAASIEPNECTVALHPGSGSGDEFTGSFDIACPEGKKIAIVGSTCEVQIGAQSGLGPVSYDLLTAGVDEVEAGFGMEAASGFTYTKVKDGASCPFTGTGVKSDGTVDGATKVRAGDLEFEPIDLWIE